jgi:hypothetical protein
MEPRHGREKRVAEAESPGVRGGGGSSYWCCRRCPLTDRGRGTVRRDVLLLTDKSRLILLLQILRIDLASPNPCCAE